MVGHGADAYLAQMQGLLPSGAAWIRETGSTLARLLAGMAQEFARIEARITDLIAEYDPRSTTELLGEWETMLGLPDPCTAAITDIDGRRLQCWRKLAYQAGQTPAFYIAMAASIGYVIEIHEFDPDVDDWDSSLTPLIGDERWRYVWRVDVLNAGYMDYFVAGDEAGDPLLDVLRMTDMECAIRTTAPAHTRVIFTYPVVEE